MLLLMITYENYETTAVLDFITKKKKELQSMNYDEEK